MANENTTAPRVTAEQLHDAAPEYIITAMIEYDRAGGDDGHGDDAMGVWREFADALATKSGSPFPSDGQLVEGRPGTNRSGEVGVLEYTFDGNHQWFVGQISGSVHGLRTAGPYTEDSLASAWKPRAVRAPEPKPVTYRELPPELQAVWREVYAGLLSVNTYINFEDAAAGRRDAEEEAWEAVRRANGGVPFNVEHDERTCGLCSTGYTKACAESRPKKNVDKRD